MPKPRRKAQVRALAEARNAPFRQPKPPPPPGPPDWRAVFVAALSDGASVVDAARIAGVSRSRAYQERHLRCFCDAWDQAVWTARRRWVRWHEPRFVRELTADRR